jgi:outer membrane protein assembly factor BamB
MKSRLDVISNHRKNQTLLVFSCLLTVTIIALMPTSLSAAEGLIASPEPDWPQWRGLKRDGFSNEKGLLASWPQGGPKLLWKIDGLGKGWSSPIVVGNQLYITGDVGQDLVIFAFDRNGKPVWQTKNGKYWKNPYPGARATCAFSEGKLYHLNAHGRLVCLDAASGDEIWTTNILERFNAGNITLMAALNKYNGRTVWTTEPLDNDRASHSSPILFQYQGRRLIANCSAAHGFGVDADTGKLLWTVPLRNPHGVNASTPIYGSGKVYYVTPYAENGRLYRLVMDGQGITTEHIWSSQLDTVTGSSVLVDGTLFAAGYKKSKWWFGVDWQTGKTKYELKDFTTGAAIYADGRLYCLDESGPVGLMKWGSNGLETAGRFRLYPKKTRDAWAHPVLLDGRLYLRYHETLWCYDVKK